MTASNGFLTKADFLATKKRRFKEFPVPELGKCRIRSMTAGEWEALNAQNYTKAGTFNAEAAKLSDARLIAFCLVDHDGNQLFGKDDIGHLMDLDTSIVLPLVKEIQEFCRLRGTVEDAEKNLNGTGDAGSPVTSSAPPAQEAATGHT